MASVADPTSRSRPPLAVLAGLGAALIALNGLGLAILGDWDADYGFVAVALAQGALYLVAAAVVRRHADGPGPLVVVLAVAALLRLGLVAAEPPHSTDLYRYIWDGRVQAAGINPYRYIPADPALHGLRDDEIFPRINRADYAPTIYPPAAQLSFLAVTRIAEAPWALKLGWLALEGAAVVALMQLLRGLGRPRHRVLLYAWHPLPVWEIAGGGHVDVGAMAFLVLAVMAAAGGRRLATGVLLAVSLLFKPLAVAALPAFWKPWDLRLPAALAATVLLLYLPYAVGVGPGVFGFLGGYVGEEGIVAGSGFFALALIEAVTGRLPPAATAAYAIAALVILAALSWSAVRDRRTDAAAIAGRAQVLLVAFLLLLSPNYPWYFVVLVPLGCLKPWPPALALTLLAPVLYAAPPVDGRTDTLIAQGVLYGIATAAIAAAVGSRWWRSHMPAVMADEKHTP
jgi:hypothetical protein